MKWFDALAGRRQAASNDLDALFLVPSASLTLQTAADWRPSGTGSVCYRAAAGAAFAQTQTDIAALISDGDGPSVDITNDQFGFTWLVTRSNPDDLTELCTNLHAVNTSLEEQGFAEGLLCSMVTFTSAARSLGLVYLYKQGTFYPFVPSGPQQRDNLAELGVRDLLAAELPMEPDLQKWLAVWDAPGL